MFVKAVAQRSNSSDMYLRRNILQIVLGHAMNQDYNINIESCIHIIIVVTDMLALEWYTHMLRLAQSHV